MDLIDCPTGNMIAVNERFSNYCPSQLYVHSVEPRLTKSKYRCQYYVIYKFRDEQDPRRDPTELGKVFKHETDRLKPGNTNILQQYFRSTDQAFVVTYGVVCFCPPFDEHQNLKTNG